MDADHGTDPTAGRPSGAGDDASFDELYRRYFDRVYDFALRVSRDRNLAALTVQASFLGAYGAMRGDEPRASFELQLFANAHHDLAQRLRGRREPSEHEEPFDAADPARLPDSSAAAQLAEAAPIAWRAALDLKLDEYELLDLSVRQRLDEGEIASVLRTRPEAVQSRLVRANAEYESAFAALILATKGRHNCVDLDFLVGEDAWSAGKRRRIAKHLETCQTCQTTRRKYPEASAIFAALTPVPAPAGWSETILTRLQGAVDTSQVPATRTVAPPPVVPPPAASGRPLPAPAPAGAGLGGLFGGNSRGPLLAVLGGGIILVAVIAGTLCVAGAFDGGGGPSGGTPTATETGTQTVTSTPTTTGTPTATGTATVPPATEAPPTAPPTPTPVPPTAPPPTSTPVPPTATPPPVPTVPGGPTASPF